MPKLVVQMGHTGRPPNAGSVGTAGEQEFARVVGAECVRLLNRNGWTVALVLADPTLAAYRADAFVAIHCDGSTSSASRGASVGYQSTEGRAFAYDVKDAYERLGWPEGNWKGDNYTTALAQYYGVRNAVAQGTRRAFIFETGTLTNPDDRALLHSEDGPDRVALAIGAALGIINLEEYEMTLTARQADQLNQIYDALAAAFVRTTRTAGDLLADVAYSVGQVETKVNSLAAAVAPLGDDETKTLGAVGQLSTKVDALTNDEANVIAAVRGLQLGQVDVPALATALAPLLPPETTAEELAEAVSDEIARRQQD